MLYVDTSIVVSALTPETASGAVQHWLAAQDPETLAISEWTITEFSSALSIKLRTGQIDVLERTTALAAFTKLLSETFLIVSIAGLHFRAAAKLCDDHGSTLKSGDALHLAVVRDIGATLITMDSGFSKSAMAIGVKTQLLPLL